MTLEDRIARIENALIADGKLDPLPGPSYHDAIQDLLKGDNTALKKYFIAHPPHLEPPRRVRRQSNGTKPILQDGLSISGMPRIKKAADRESA